MSSLGVPGVPCPPPQILADQLNLSQPGGADYSHHISTCTPWFPDLPTVLLWFLLKPRPVYQFQSSKFFESTCFPNFQCTVELSNVHCDWFGKPMLQAPGKQTTGERSGVSSTLGRCNPILITWLKMMGESFVCFGNKVIWIFNSFTLISLINMEVGME